MTSEYKESDDNIVDIYRGFWNIEESFKITKSDFKGRPVYLSLKEHIDAHFLTCFISLVILRILEHRINRKHPPSAILESLRESSCSLNQENYYLFDFYDQVLKFIGEEVSIDFSLKNRSLADIKNNLGDTKKV